MPTYTNRAIPTESTYTNRTGPISDLGAGLDEDLSIMTDEDDNIIIFHTGDFVNTPTEYTNRVIPT